MGTRTPRSFATEQPASDAETERRRIQIEKTQAAIALLTKWRTTTNLNVIREQQETWAVLQQALGRDRAISNRSLFPDEAGE